MSTATAKNTHKKTHLIGMVDYNGHGRANHAAEIDVELRDTDKGPELSICGSIWLPSRRDIVQGGQCIDTIAEYFPENARLQRLVEIWREYHLNGMTAGCEHQRAAWDTSEKLEIVHYKLTLAAFQMRDSAIARAARCAAEGRNPELTPTESALILCDDWFKRTAAPDADSPLSGCFEVKRRETKTAGWVTPSEHPRGLLCKPCYVCGYKYGTAWLYRPIPADVLAEIETWL